MDQTTKKEILSPDVLGGTNKIKIMSFNSSGLRNKKKRLSLFRIFKKEKLDIISLQETYLLEKEKESIEKEWGGKVIIVQGTTRSKGQAILCSKEINDKFDIKELHADSRLLLVNIKADKREGMLLANIYAPCDEKERKDFFQKTTDTLKYFMDRYPDSPLICMGDFNSVIDNELDVIAGNYHSKDSVATFNRFVNKLEMYDSWRIKNKHQRAYTWSRGNPMKARRLDYVFISKNALQFLENSEIKSLSFSDHRAVITNLSFTQFKRGPSMFKMNTAMLNDPSYVKMIKERINIIKQEQSLDPHLAWENIKIEAKTCTQEYSRYKSMIKKKSYNEVIDELNKLEERLTVEPDNREIAAQIFKLKNKIEIKMMEETKGAQIRAGIKWIEEGEKCNKFFLNLEKSRAHNNTIHRIKDTSGNIVTNEKQILSVMSTFYENLYKEPKENSQIQNDSAKFVEGLEVPKLSTEEADLCEDDLSAAEILKALKTMKNGSSPGTDGIPVEFYKFFWNDIKEPLLACFKYSLEANDLAYSQKRGVISLIPKSNELDREEISNWRPITLTNVDYKILTKALAFRLRLVIHKIVSNDQKGFIKGRNASQLLREIDDIIEHEKAIESQSLIFSIDYRKAFDTISTQFLKNVFGYFGFGPAFQQWIGLILHDRKTCIKNGGHVSADFDMQRGVRQGCPISPLIFVLAVEIMSLKIKQDKDIKGITIGSFNTRIKQYADDTTFLLKDTADLKIVIDILEQFSLCSGLTLNKSKSKILHLNKMNAETAEEGLGFEFVKNIKVLGVHFGNETAATENEANWTNKIEKIKKILASWEKRNISILGKITLVKTYGISQLIYLMQSISIPFSVLNAINRLFFQFIWRKKFSNKRAFEKVKRKTMYNEYKNGGLQMIDLEALQKSFLINWAKQLLCSEEEQWKGPVKQILKNVGGLQVLECKTDSNQFRGNDSIISVFWKRVLKEWLDFKEKGHKNIVVLSDPIFNNSNIRIKGKTLFSKEMISREIFYVKDFFIDNRLKTLREIKEQYGSYNGMEIDFSVIKTALSNIQIEDTEDIQEIGSLKNTIRKLSRKEVYKELRSSRDPMHVRNFWTQKGEEFNSDYWMIPIKCTQEVRLRVLQWKIIHNIYPTNILLQKMKIVESNKCNTCKEVDYSEHFFFHCERVKGIWKEIETLILHTTGHLVKLTMLDVMLGILSHKNINRNDLKWINHVIMVGKMVISKFKYGPVKHPLEILKNDLHLRKLYREGE